MMKQDKKQRGEHNSFRWLGCGLMMKQDKKQLILLFVFAFCVVV